jgi:hypothetical protein
MNTQQKPLPEAVKEIKTEVDSVFLRTVIRRDVYERLRDFSKEFSTGQGNWDFGIGVQILLDYYDNSKLALQNEKLDLIINMINTPKQEEVVKPKEEDYMELLGGEKILRRG